MAEAARLRPAAGSPEALREMLAEIESADEIYRPSEFWNYHNTLNLKQFEEAGLANFKLTANQNYHNFTPHLWRDDKFRQLFRWWLRAPSLEPLRFGYERAPVQPGDGGEALDQRRVLRMTRRRFLMYRLFVGLVWCYSESVDAHGVLSRMEEPELGNPIRLRHEGKLVSQDLATSSRELNAIVGAMAPGRVERPLTVGEVGAGYGRLAHVFLEATPCRYFIFDIPPALHVSQWYLSRLMPSKKIFAFRHFDRWAEVEEEVANADIAFFTANQIARFPDAYFDLTLSVSSLHEMRFAQIDNYMEHLARLSREYLYIKQYYRYPNAFDGIVVERSAYKAPAGWNTVFERTEPIYTDFFELMLERAQ